MPAGREQRCEGEPRAPTRSGSRADNSVSIGCGEGGDGGAEHPAELFRAIPGDGERTEMYGRRRRTKTEHGDKTASLGSSSMDRDHRRLLKNGSRRLGRLIAGRK